MAEGVEGLVGAVKIPGFILCIRVDVGTAGVLGVVVDGHLTKAAGEGDGEFSGGVVVPEEDIGHGIGAHGAGIPGFQDGVCEFGFCAEIQRTAVKEHYRHLLALLPQGLQEFRLLLGEIDGCAGSGLSGPAPGLSKHKDHLV